MLLLADVQTAEHPCNLSFVKTQEMAHHCPCSCHSRKGLGGPCLWLAGHQDTRASDSGIIHPCLTHFCPSWTSCSLSTRVCFLGLCKALLFSLLPATRGSESPSGKGSFSRQPVYSHFYSYTSKTFSYLKSPSSSPDTVTKVMGLSMAPLVGPEVHSTST